MHKKDIVAAAWKAMTKEEAKHHSNAWAGLANSSSFDAGKNENMFVVNKIVGGLTNLLSTVRPSDELIQRISSSSAIIESVDTSDSKRLDNDAMNSSSLKIPTNTKQLSKVLVRQYGKGTDVLIKRSDEESIAVELSSSGIAPIVYGTFNGGRVEEYFEGSRSLKCSELQDKEILKRIGSLLARFHCQNIESVARTDAFKERLQRWFVASKIILDENERKVKSKTDSLNRHDRNMFFFDIKELESEIDWFVNTAVPDLIGKDAPLVFCHYDVQEGNILKRPDRKNDLFLIDFEYSGYGNRGFDFGNLFCEMTLDYNVSNFPGFVCNPDNYPSEEQCDVFFQSYSDSWNSINESRKIVKIDDLKKEAALFELASHLIWTLWSIIESESSLITFGFLEYGQARWGQYLSRKARYLGKDQGPSNIEGSIHP